MLDSSESAPHDCLRVNRDTYSPSDFLWQVLLGYNDGKDLLMCMFKAYFDASGKEQEGTVVVAGWLATTDKWAEFQPRWNAILASYGVPYFHMKEFAHSVGAFSEGWRGRELKRRRFLADLIQVIYDTVEYGIAFGASYDNFKIADREYKMSEKYGNAYALVAHSCMRQVSDYMEAFLPELPKREVAYYFESGDSGMHHVVRLAEEDGLPIPGFHPSRRAKDAPKGGGLNYLVQLQSADFAAYEAFRATQAFEKFGADMPDTDLRMTAQYLTKIPHTWGVHPSKGIEAAIARLGVERRTT